MLPPPGIRGVYRTDARARAAYAEGAGIYRIIPCAVALPADLEDLKRLICWTAEHRIGLIPRGAGSAMGGGNVGDGVIVDLTRMSPAPPVIDSSRNHGFAPAGTTLARLNAEAGRHGLRLPPDPSSGRWATLGGMVATNASGARSVRYGSVRPWVNALTLMTADGEAVELRRGETERSRSPNLAVARFDRMARPAIQASASLIRARFPRTRKNSSGYALDAYLDSENIIDLAIGAEGTLGIVTDIEWRLAPIPAERAGLRIALPTLDRLSELIQSFSPLQPSALELLDQSFLELVGADQLADAGLRVAGIEAVLLVEFERNDRDALGQALEEATTRARALATSIDTAFSTEAADRLWAVRHAASPILARLPQESRSLQVIEDACVPLPRVSEYIRGVRAAAAEHRIPVVIFGHAGDGHIHVNLLPNVTRAGWETSVSSLQTEVTSLVVRLGGTLSGEHGDGRLRAVSLAQVYGPDVVRLFRVVKDSFDPLGIFNPGVILSSGEPSISRLKVGANAAPLPEDISTALRQIEQSGGYATPRLELAGDNRES
jgi:FAD/FMN-containing dehydrogenase